MEGFKPPQGYSWRYNNEMLERYYNEGLIELSDFGNPKMKVYTTSRKREVSLNQRLYFKFIHKRISKKIDIYGVE